MFLINLLFLKLFFLRKRHSFKFIIRKSFQSWRVWNSCCVIHSQKQILPQVTHSNHCCEICLATALEGEREKQALSALNHIPTLRQNEFSSYFLPSLNISKHLLWLEMCPTALVFKEKMGGSNSSESWSFPKAQCAFCPLLCLNLWFSRIS